MDNPNPSQSPVAFANSILDAPDIIACSGKEKHRSIMGYIADKKELLKAVGALALFVAAPAFAASDVPPGPISNAAAINLSAPPPGADNSDAAMLTARQIKGSFTDALDPAKSVDYMSGLPGESEGYLAVNVDSGSVFNAMLKPDQSAIKSAVSKAGVTNFQGVYPTRVSYIDSHTNKRTSVGSLFFKQPSDYMVSVMQQTLKQNHGKYDDSTFAAFAQSLGYSSALGESDIHGMKTRRSDHDLAKDQVYACLVETQKGYPMVTDMTLDMYKAGVFDGGASKELVMRSLDGVKSIDVSVFMHKTPAQLVAMADKIVKNASLGHKQAFASTNAPAHKVIHHHLPADVLAKAKSFISQAKADLQGIQQSGSGSVSGIQDQAVGAVKSAFSKIGI